MPRRTFTRPSVQANISRILTALYRPATRLELEQRLHMEASTVVVYLSHMRAHGLVKVLGKKGCAPLYGLVIPK